MKKTLMLSSLLAVVAMAAGTTGSVEFTNENEAKFEKGSKPTYTVKKALVKTEVKVSDTGLSFGGELKAENIPVPMGDHKLVNNFFNHSNVFVKYDLPEIKGFNSYVKGTLTPKVGDEDKLSFKKGNAQLEADVNYEVVKDLKLGLNTKTTFPFEGTDYAKAVTSTHKAYVKGNYAPLKDIKGEVEVKHSYKHTSDTQKDAFKYVSLLAEAKYDVIKNLELNGQFKFKYNFNDEIKLENLGDKDFLGIVEGFGDTLKDNKMKYAHSYVLGAKYTGLKGTEINGKAFVGHASDGTEKDTVHFVHYGVKADVKYTGVKNLTLTGKTTLAGLSDIITSEDPIHYGLFNFGLGAKYDYKVTDKFTVSPELNTDLSFFTEFVAVDNISLSLTPKVSAEYKPAESLTVKGEVSVPVNFKGFASDFGYTDTQVKTALNIKYEWK